MVNFNWGKQTLSLPRSASFIETQMKNYILDGNKEFRRRVRKAKESVEDSEPNSAALKSELTKILEKVLDELRPFLISDGGNVEIAEIDGPIVKVRLQGACGSCPSSTMTLKMGIERKLKEMIPEISEVVQVL